MSNKNRPCNIMLITDATNYSHKVDVKRKIKHWNNVITVGSIDTLYKMHPLNFKNNIVKV